MGVISKPVIDMTFKDNPACEEYGVVKRIHVSCRNCLAKLSLCNIQGRQKRHIRVLECNQIRRPIKKKSISLL